MKIHTNSFKVFILAVAVFASFCASAQEDKSKRPSPPAVASKKIGATTITINYSQPSVKGRKIFGSLEPYGKVWRAGANEATTFEVDKDVKIDGQSLPAGKYGFFVIPNEKESTIIFNKVANQWGAFKYDQSQDALRVNVPTKKSASFNEKLTYAIDGKGKTSLLWENTQFDFTVQ